MTLRQYLTIMIVATLLCWVSWIFVLMNVDPFTSGLLGFLFFYVSLFFLLVGTLSLLIFGLYHLFSHSSLPLFRYVQYSFRDAVVLSVFILALLWLQSQRLLQWWNVGLFIGIVIAVGIIMSVRRQSA